MEYQFGGLAFKGPVIFRPDTSGPLLGINPIRSYFNIFFDNSQNVVKFIPLQTPVTIEKVEPMNSLMWLRRVVVAGVSALLGRAIE